MIRRIGWGLAIVGLTAGAASGQSGRRVVAPPVVASVFPPGGQVGTTVAWNFTGRGFARVRQVLVSGQGLRTTSFAAEGDVRAVATVEIAPDATPGYRELRLEGPDGISNLVLVRFDTLPQGLEAEPNDAIGEAQKVPVGSCVAGTVRATDVDHFRVEGKPGQELTLDLEARRVGTSITPVLSALNSRGVSLAQARESRSGDHDCRLAVKLPKDGVLIAQVRDNTYSGSESATYRLRVTTTPYATGMYPLGGPRGKPVYLTAMGGSLKRPLTKTFWLPDTPGAMVDPGPFESPEGIVEAPMKVIIGDGLEAYETHPGVLEFAVSADGHPPAIPKEVRAAPDEAVAKRAGAKPKDRVDERRQSGEDFPLPVDALASLKVGRTTNGLIGHRGEVDRFAMTVKKGEKFRIRVVAEPLGSWLDSVLTVRNEKGEQLAENDDFSVTNESPNRRGVNFLGVMQGSSDSAVNFEAPADGPIAIEVTDRYGDGGPEYGYRLSVGASRPDFAVYVLIGNPTANGQVANAVNNHGVMTTPGLFGVYNLRPGTRVPVNFLVVPEGRPGPVTVRVEGLPDGLSVAPVKVEVLGPGPKGGSSSLVNVPSKAENFVLDIPAYASPGVSEFRVVATAEPEPGKTITRMGSATIGLEAVPSAVPARPITRRIDRFPLRIIGEERKGLVGPPEEARLKSVKVPGVLLQGDRIELGLEFDASPLLDPGFAFDAKAKGPGLATNTVVVSEASDPESDEDVRGDVRVRVMAAADAAPGVHPVTVSYTMTGGGPHATELAVIVRPPISLLNRSEAIALKPGGLAELWVGVRREIGCVEEVEIRIEGLPEGVKAEALTLKEGETEGVLNLEMPASAIPLAKATAVRVVASVRMPRGVVAVASGNRPMIVAGPAD